MWRLAGPVTMAIVDEYGPGEMLRRLSDPWWFQAFGCAMGMDWHSSGITTVTCGALKEAYRHFGDEMGIHVAGGKGGTSRQTPAEIEDVAGRLGIATGEKLVWSSRMSAKVDSAAVQDGYELYHHSFFFSADGQWCVVQQGMNVQAGYARRYHWLAESVSDFVCEPHHAVAQLASRRRGPDDGRMLLNMVAGEAEANRRASVELVAWNPDRLLGEIERMTSGPTLFAPAGHRALPPWVNPRRIGAVVRQAHERNPRDFVSLLGTEGVGAAAVRSLSLLAELIYNAPAAHRDVTGLVDADGRRWADYSYVHGGKDGTPHPVDRQTYDRNIELLTEAVRKARVGETHKRDALRRLAAATRRT